MIMTIVTAGEATGLFCAGLPRAAGQGLSRPLTTPAWNAGWSQLSRGNKSLPCRPNDSSPGREAIHVLREGLWGGLRMMKTPAHPRTGELHFFAFCSDFSLSVMLPSCWLHCIHQWLVEPLAPSTQMAPAGDMHTGGAWALTGACSGQDRARTWES